MVNCPANMPRGRDSRETRTDVAMLVRFLELRASGLLPRLRIREAMTRDLRAAEGQLIPQSTELLIRMFLWQGHGHEGIYGDDGEMQCGQCGCDYKRDTLHACVEKARVAALETGLKRLAASGPSRPEPDYAALESHGKAVWATAISLIKGEKGKTIDIALLQPKALKDINEALAQREADMRNAVLREVKKIYDDGSTSQKVYEWLCEQVAAPSTTP